MVQRAEQRMMLLPKMLQAIEILQLSTQDLEGLIEQEVTCNAVLEVAEPPRAEAAAPPVQGAPAREDEPWSPDERGSHDLRRRSGEDLEDRYDAIQDVAAPSLSLQGHLLEQVSLLELEPRLREAVTFLIGNVDRNGHLLLPESEIPLYLGEDQPVAQALATLRSLDPRGVGATCGRHSLVLQIDEHDPDGPALRTLIAGHLEDIAGNRLVRVARSVGVAMPELRRLLVRLRELEPHPGLAFGAGAPGLVRPDLLVANEGGRFVVAVVDAYLPRLSINHEYERLAKDAGAPKDLRTFLKERIGTARGLLFALTQRRQTLARVAQAMMDRQRGFLEQGVRFLRPMKMQEIADALGVHVSTVSRAVADKYFQTELGIFRLRSLFDGGVVVGSAGGRGGTSRAGVKDAIRALVEAEDKRLPLSDDDIVTLMRVKGLPVARRTVTKYRRELGLPSSWERRTG
jgi:RNA polymerase sigma-54 factor